MAPLGRGSEDARRASEVRKVDACEGTKRDRGLKDPLYLNWICFKNETAARPQRFLPPAYED